MQTRTAETVAHAPAPLSAGDAPLAQFFIPAAASLQERRPRILKHGDTFAVFDHNGDALAGPGSPEGLYHRDTRHLSHFYLTIGGVRPMLLSSNSRDDNASLTCDLTNPDLYDAAGRLVLAHDLIHIRRSRFLWNGACFERLSVRNFDESRRSVRIEIAFAADFADIFEVRGTRRERRGSDHQAEITPHSVTLAYTGLDGRRRDTALHFDPAPVALTASQAVFAFSLAPREAQLAFLEIHCDGERHRQTADNSEPPYQKRETRRAFFVALRDARRALRISSSRAATVATSNEICNEAVRRGVSDLYMLVTNTPEGPYPYAGIPWFSTVFGRDALITALEMLWLDPTIARGVLRHLAANQATQYDPVADAEPGKILHELRQGEMAELGEVPFRRYYGSVDSTPLFVMLAGAYLARTGDVAILTKLWPHIDAALKWIETDGDRDGDGFVEYGRRTADGLINQGWKDSHDSIFHADGSLASGPIALVEVQAYVYGAWRAAAHIAQALGYGRRAQEFDEKARILRKRFDESFFDEDLATYVLALDGHKQPCRVRASNAGHALFTGIALPERAPVVVETLMARSSFSGWGVRTVATTEARYNPMSYHNGSVWPHDNAIIAAGFARYGFRHQAARVFEGLFSSSLYIDQRRLPELFCGFPRQRSRGPTFYPVACIPQAWAAAAPLSLIQSCLGLGFNMADHETIFDEPVLPDFLDEITLHRLAVGGGSVDVALRRAGHQVVVNVLSRRGDVRVLTRN
ncbi:amylo-alpha-1,6-glucosidase [Chelatococcus asaccharovorans]|uniref:Glycogen debranching enzyme n=1 Tax=Chelatococcus asaccharovorans TaxID=28210 RepID=A0A2V3U3E2_9HYPH|nr:amylo-alpha-1,6-glucosidase [Chelatococcus asaccharovorans]MBS7702719.1 amylo-alpha-1,6-glucosidase [Chelatococcus asaccharovorans]PXW57011.1 glycogen debranching enzyme [Chelatococcus asaccharovorans]CAH1672271.1 Glycogen debranching enzyme [Chelatococcus asaccharovorans]CAH1676324.1 Glycogen debranching enzyme [Chelatococcus asaccharovorans]